MLWCGWPHLSLKAVILVVLCFSSSPSYGRISPRLVDGPLCSTSAIVHLGQAPLHVQLDSWGDDSIRIRMSPDEVQQIPYVQALLPFPPGLIPPFIVDGSTSPSLPPPCQVTSRHQSHLNAADLTNGNLAVSVSTDGHFTVQRIEDGATLIQSSTIRFTPVTLHSVYAQNYSLYSLSLSYAHLHGQVYGLGEHRTNRTEYVDYFHRFEWSQLYGASLGGDISIPFYISTAGFGLLYNQAGYGSIHITRESAEWYSNATHQLDLWVTTHPQSSGAITPFPAISSHYADATGHPNPLPHFASGFWQSRDRYRNQSEVLSVASRFHVMSIPVSVLIIDWMHWQYLGDWSFWLPQCWPDPTAMVKEVSSYGMHTMISVWPRVDPRSSHYAEMSALHYFTSNASGHEMQSDGQAGFIYDAFNPYAREYVWKALLEGYVTHGIQLFWLDAAEPEQSLPGQQWWNGHSDLEVGMMWVIKHQTTIYEGALDSGIHGDDIIMLARHGWVGSNLLNAAVWSGDLQSDWDSFIVQVKLAPNVQLSGLHWWATDIGGYAGGRYTDPGFNELLVRWFQWGAFLPIFRTHGHREPSEESELCGGGGGPNEVWAYQHEAEIAAVIELRESIRPYVEFHLRVASKTGVPILQPMWYNFTDPQCLEADAETQFMFGDTFLVAPVLSALGNASSGSRSVYLPTLPANEAWVHFYSGEVYEGGSTVAVLYKLADFPLFQRLPRSEAHAGFVQKLFSSTQ